MAEVTFSDTKHADLPTIIVDPTAYEPEPTLSVKTPRRGFVRLTRVTLAAVTVGGATFGIARLLEVDSFSQERLATFAPWEDTGPVASSTSAQRARESAPQAALTQEPAQPPPSTQTAAAANAPPSPGAEADAVDAHRDPAQASADRPTPAAQQQQDEATLAHSAGPSPGEAPVGAEAVVNPATPAAPPLGAEAIVDPATPAAPRPLASVAQRVESPAPPKALATPVADAAAAVRDARRLLATNRLSEAEAAYRKILKATPNEAAALTGLARIQLAHGQLDDALASATHAVQEGPGVAGSHVTLGDVLRARGDETSAREHYALASQIAASTRASEP